MTKTRLLLAAAALLIAPGLALATEPQKYDNPPTAAQGTVQAPPTPVQKAHPGDPGSAIPEVPRTNPNPPVMKKTNRGGDLTPDTGNK